MFDRNRAQAELPEAIFASDMSSSTRPLLVATGYVKTLASAFSGSSYYLAKAGMRNGSLDGIFTAQSELGSDVYLRAQGAAWVAARKLKGQKAGGFKFATRFQDSIWKRSLPLIAGSAIIDNFQTRGGWFLDNYERNDVRLFCYIDGTLSEYFSTYRNYDCANIDDVTMQEAIAFERRGYECAEHIIAMCQRTRSSLINDYAISPDKISIVVPGANIDEDLVEAVSAPPRRVSNGEFVLVFIGLYPERKGLDRLAAAVSILRGRGCAVRLRVIGRCPAEIQAMDGIDFFGVVNKAKEPHRFAEILKGAHLGCQLSWAELFGIAMMEFLRFGIPILATSAGGLPDIVSGGGGILVPREITAEELADRIEQLATDPGAYAELAEGACRQSGWASWTRASSEIGNLLRPRIS